MSINFRAAGRAIENLKPVRFSRLGNASTGGYNTVVEWTAKRADLANQGADTQVFRRLSVLQDSEGDVWRIGATSANFRQLSERFSQQLPPGQGRFVSGLPPKELTLLNKASWGKQVKGVGDNNGIVQELKELLTQGSGKFRRIVTTDGASAEVGETLSRILKALKGE